MSLIQSARQALTDAAVGGIVRERLSLALDELEAHERRIAELQIQVGELRAEANGARTGEQQARVELERLKKEHEEEVIIDQAIEFRRGKRTGYKWLPFCPKCHLPAEAPLRDWNVSCTDDKHCGWTSALPGVSLPMVMANLPK